MLVPNRRGNFGTNPRFGVNVMCSRTAEKLGSNKVLTVIALLVLLPAGAILRAQRTSSATVPSFDVASLKPVQLTPGPYRANLGTANHGEVVLANVTLSDSLKFAYGITNDAQIVGPDWTRNREVRFDIVGKAAPDTPRAQLLLMLQTLLADRFKLVLHREQRVLTVLALVTSKNGPKFREAADDSSGSNNRVALGVIISNRITMSVLATLFEMSPELFWEWLLVSRF